MSTATHKTVIDLSLETREAEVNAARLQSALDKISATAASYALGGGSGARAGVSATGAAQHPGVAQPAPASVAAHPGTGAQAGGGGSGAVAGFPGTTVINPARVPLTPEEIADRAATRQLRQEQLQQRQTEFAARQQQQERQQNEHKRLRQMAGAAFGLHGVTQAGGLLAQEQVAGAQLSPETPFAYPFRAAGAATQGVGGLGMAGGLALGGPVGLGIAAVGAIATIVGQQLSAHGELKGMAAGETYRNIQGQVGMDRSLATGRFRGGRGTMAEALDAAQRYDMSAQEVTGAYERYTGAVGYRHASGMLGVSDVARLSRAGVGADVAGQYAGLSALGVQGGNVERLAAMGQSAGLEGQRLTGYLQAMAAGISQMASQGMKVDAGAWETLAGRLLGTKGMAPGQAQAFEQNLMTQRGSIREQMAAPLRAMGQAAVEAEIMSRSRSLGDFMEQAGAMDPAADVRALAQFGPEVLQAYGAPQEAARAIAAGRLGPEGSAQFVSGVGYGDYERGGSARTARAVDLGGAIEALGQSAALQAKLLEEIRDHMRETRSDYTGMLR